MSLGKTQKEAEDNKDAMNDLADAMKKGSVKVDKVFPHLVKLMTEASAPGVALARTSPTAEEQRFWSRMDIGWKNFSEGGGKSGLALFWKDLQTSVGAWFEENGAWLGGQFESMMKWFKVFRIGLTDFVKFMWSGDHNSFTNWVAQEWNFDLANLRTFFIDLWTNVKMIFSEIAKAIGLVDKDGNMISGFGDRIQTFITNLSTVFSELMKMLGALAESMHNYGKIVEGGWGSIYASVFNPLSESYKNRMTAEGSMFKAVGHLTAATGAAVVTQAGIVTGTQAGGEDKKPYGFQAPYTPASPSAMFPANRLAGTSGSSGAPIRPYAPRIGQAITSEAGGVKAPDWFSGPSPTLQNAVPTTDWMNGEKPKSATLDVNVKVEVAGDPENMRLFAAEEVAKGIAEQVPKMVDYSFSSKLTGAYTGASKY